MQCHLQLLLLPLHYLVPPTNAKDWKIDTYQKGDNNTVNTHIVSDNEVGNDYMEDSQVEVMDDSTANVDNSFWDMVNPEAFYNKYGGSSDYSDFNIKANLVEPEGENGKN